MAHIQRYLRVVDQQPHLLQLLECAGNLFRLQTGQLHQLVGIHPFINIGAVEKAQNSLELLQSTLRQLGLQQALLGLFLAHIQPCRENLRMVFLTFEVITTLQPGNRRNDLGFGITLIRGEAGFNIIVQQDFTRRDDQLAALTPIARYATCAGSAGCRGC